MDPTLVVTVVFLAGFAGGAWTALQCVRSRDARRQQLQLPRRELDRPALDALSRVGRSH